MDSHFKINGGRSDRRAVRREVSTKKNHLISVFNSFEFTISDKKKRYFDKIQSLLTAWEQIAAFVCEASAESPQPEFDSLFLHTLRFVLRADWTRANKALQTHLSVTLQRFATVLSHSKNFPSILQQCRVLESVVQKPWTHPVLSKILADEEVEFNELMDYFQFENGKVIVVRLEMLLESKCEDIAVRLSKSCLSIYYNSEPLEIDMTQKELDYITDIYFCSLYKTKKKKELTDEIKTYELDEGLQLLQRYNKNGGVGGTFNDACKEARVWKYSKKVIELVSNTLLANAVINDDLVDSDTILQDLISEWASIYRPNTDEVFSPVALEMIRKLVLIAGSSKCIYPFCSFLIENCRAKELYMNHVAQCLIRAINQNMNEIEQFRVNHERDKLKQTYDQLSEGFVLISQLFSDYTNICKECLLTSFSLTPSRECLQKVEAFVDTLLSDSVSKNGEPTATEPSEPVDAAATNNNNNVSSPEAKAVAPAVGQEHTELNEILESMGVNKNDVPSFEVGIAVKPNDLAGSESRGAAPSYCGEVESLRLDESIKTDLDSILRYQRFHTLTWDLEWCELKANCEKYLEVFEKRGGFDEVELKYLDLDYNQFKDRPINDDEYCGIEKGYEHCMALSPAESDDEPLATRFRARSSSLDDYDSDSDEPRSKKRKKSLKRPKPKLPKPHYDEANDWDDLLAFVESNVVGGTPSPSLDVGRPAKNKAKRGRLLKSKSAAVLSGGNADSQSENQPPDDVDVPEEEPLNGVMSLKSDPNTVQMLRQFRMNVKPLDETDHTVAKDLELGDGEKENHVASDLEECMDEKENQLTADLQVVEKENHIAGDLKERNVVECKSHAADELKSRNVIESRHHIPGGILKICIPKCDNEIINGRLRRPYEKRKSSPMKEEATTADHRETHKKSKERRSHDKRPQYKSTAMLIASRRPNNSVVIKRISPKLEVDDPEDFDDDHNDFDDHDNDFDDHDDFDDFTIECEVRLPKADVNGFFASGKNGLAAVRRESEDAQNEPKAEASELDENNKPASESVKDEEVEESVDESTDISAVDEADAEETTEAEGPVDELQDVLLDLLNDMSSNFTDCKKAEVKTEVETPPAATETAPSTVPCSVMSSPAVIVSVATPSVATPPLVLSVSTATPPLVPSVSTATPPLVPSVSTATLPFVPSVSTAPPIDQPVKAKKERKKPKPAGEEGTPSDVPRKPRKSKPPTGRPRGRPKGSVTKKKTDQLNPSLNFSSYLAPADFSSPSYAAEPQPPRVPLSYPSAPVQLDSPTASSATCQPQPMTNYSVPSRADVPTPISYLSVASIRAPNMNGGEQSNFSPPSQSSFSHRHSHFQQSAFAPAQSNFNQQSAQPNYSQPSPQPTYNPTAPSSVPHSYLQPNVCLTDISRMRTQMSTANYNLPPPSSSSSSMQSTVVYSSAVPPTSTVTYSTSSAHFTDATPAPYSETLVYSPTSSASGVAYGVPTTTSKSSKLRAALQNPVTNHVDLYDPAFVTKKTSASSPAKEAKVEAVHQILGVYRETLDKFPELEHVPAPRKRTANGTTPKRQRKRKNAKEEVAVPAEVANSFANQRFTPTVSSAAYASTSFATTPTTYGQQPMTGYADQNRLPNRQQFQPAPAESQFRGQFASGQPSMTPQYHRRQQGATVTTAAAATPANSSSQFGKNYSTSGPLPAGVTVAPRQLQQSANQVRPQQCVSSPLKQKLPSTYMSTTQSGLSSQGYGGAAVNGYATNVPVVNGYANSYLLNQSACNVKTTPAAAEKNVYYEITSKPPAMVEVQPNASGGQLISLNAEDCVSNVNEYADEIFMTIDPQTLVIDEPCVVSEAAGELKDQVQLCQNNCSTMLETQSDELKLPLFVRDNNDGMDGVCISIPDAFFGNYLSFIDNPSFPVQTEPTEEIQTDNAGFDSEVIMRQLFYPNANSTYTGQMSSYRS